MNGLFDHWTSSQSFCLPHPKTFWNLSGVEKMLSSQNLTTILLDWLSTFSVSFCRLSICYLLNASRSFFDRFLLVLSVTYFHNARPTKNVLFKNEVFVLYTFLFGRSIIWSVIDSRWIQSFPQVDLFRWIRNTSSHWKRLLSTRTVLCMWIPFNLWYKTYFCM